MENITIPLSKGKLTLLLIGSILFVVLGAYFLAEPAKFVSPVTQNTAFIAIIGAVAVIFFGGCAFVAIKKLLDKRAGLIINSEGITDNSSGVSGGAIRWNEITGISDAQVQHQRFLLVKVKDPEKWIENEPGSFKRRMMKINYKMYGTPVCISANGLQCNFDELYKKVADSYVHYKTA